VSFHKVLCLVLSDTLSVLSAVLFNLLAALNDIGNNSIEKSDCVPSSRTSFLLVDRSSILLFPKELMGF